MISHQKYIFPYLILKSAESDYLEPVEPVSHAQSERNMDEESIPDKIGFESSEFSEMVKLNNKKTFANDKEKAEFYEKQLRKRKTKLDIEKKKELEKRIKESGIFNRIKKKKKKKLAQVNRPIQKDKKNDFYRLGNKKIHLLPTKFKRLTTKFECFDKQIYKFFCDGKDLFLKDLNHWLRREREMDISMDELSHFMAIFPIAYDLQWVKYQNEYRLQVKILNKVICDPEKISSLAKKVLSPWLNTC